MRNLIKKILKEEFKGYDWVPPKERVNRFIEFDDGWVKKVENRNSMNFIVNDEDYVVGNFYRIKFWRDRWFDIRVIDKKREYGNHHRYKYEPVNPEEAPILFRYQNNQKYGFLNNRVFYAENGYIKPIKPIGDIPQNYTWGGYPYKEVYILGYYTINEDIHDYDSELIITRSISVVSIPEFIDITSEAPEIGMEVPELPSFYMLKHFEKDGDNTIYFNESFEYTKFYYIDGITEFNLKLITKDEYEKFYNQIKIINEKSN